MHGIAVAWKKEAAFRQEFFLALILVPLAFWLGQTVLESVLLISAVLLVLVVELLNSAIEAVVDLVTEEYAELAGRAKDLGSAAVFIALLLFFLSGLMMVIERLSG